MDVVEEREEEEYPPDEPGAQERDAVGHVDARLPQPGGVQEPARVHKGRGALGGQQGQRVVVALVREPRQGHRGQRRDVVRPHVQPAVLRRGSCNLCSHVRGDG